MKAVILSGGAGARLAPLTNTVTKQLLPIANKPALFHILELIKEETPIKEVCVVVSEDFGNQVKEKLTNSIYNNHFKFEFVFQDKPLGLAHAVQLTSMHMLDSPFLMFLGDILINKGEIKNAYKKFTEDKSDCLVLLKEIDDPRPYGIAEVDNGRVTKLVEKPQDPKTNLCLAGIYFFQPSIFYAIANIKPSYRGELEITDAVDFLIQSGKIVTHYLINSWWFDVGTPENMLKANEFLLNALPNMINSELDNSVKLTGKVHIEQNVHINNSEIIGPVIISKNSVIKNCKIGPFVSLGEGVHVENVHIENSILRENTKIIGADCIISDSLFGRNIEFAFSNGNNGLKNKKVKYILGDDTKCILL